MASNIDVVRRITDEGFVGGDLDVLDELIADDFVSHDPPPGFDTSKGGYRAIGELVISAFADRKLEFDEYAETSDGRVLENWMMVGTHVGEAFGVPPSGAEVRVRGMELYRCADGRVVEHWGVVDMSDFLEKAGIIPAD